MNATMELQELAKIQRLDHDTLVRMEEHIKMIALDIKEMKEGTSFTLSDHEARLKRIETTLEIVKPEESLVEFRELQRQVRDFVVTANVFRVLGGIIGGIIVFLLTQAPALVAFLLGG